MLVIVIGEAPWIPGYDRRCFGKAILYPFLRCPHLTVPLATPVAEVNAALRQFAEQTPNVRYFEITAEVCPDGVCAAFGPDGEARYYDERHLSLAASSKIGQSIVSKRGVPEPFNLVATWNGGRRTHQVSGVP